MSGVISKLILALLSFLELRKTKRRQKERDKLENRPANFYRDHFGGMQHASSETNKTDTNTDNRT